MEPKVSVQVRLDREQHQRLERVAADRGVPVSALIRASVAAYLASIAVEDDPLFRLIGLCVDEGPRSRGDVADHHDEYLTDRVAAEGFSIVPSSG